MWAVDHMVVQSQYPRIRIGRKSGNNRAGMGDLFHGWREGCVDHWNLRRMDRHHAGKPVPSCPCSIGGQAFGIGDSGIDSLYGRNRSEEHTSELQSLMRISYAVFCLKKKIYTNIPTTNHTMQ